jgi:hypothetical protein
MSVRRATPNGYHLGGCRSRPLPSRLIVDVLARVISRCACLIRRGAPGGAGSCMATPTMTKAARRRAGETDARRVCAGWPVPPPGTRLHGEGSPASTHAPGESEGASARVPNHAPTSLDDRGRRTVGCSGPGTRRGDRKVVRVGVGGLARSPCCRARVAQARVRCLGWRLVHETTPHIRRAEQREHPHRTG